MEGYNFSFEIVTDTLSRYQLDALFKAFEEMVDLDNPAFKSDDYLELLKNDYRKADHLPDI